VVGTSRADALEGRRLQQRKETRKRRAIKEEVVEGGVSPKEKGSSSMTNGRTA